ncbi:nucleotide triphosphate diphosphatase NUDT15 [Aspergillus saccharolyticus JOP 1030-1]|uniref:Nudix hydrolase domain-containing protein n=1 Tax=Aspergillus saccharolyticus JOP 1030-1 TaxID=1450539 RepID=A0A318ZAI1_9EURO|nr:hypothetical protein BP01DRAFT_357762 [Aspergillus saccharolyticus JOP 1030-1]PYH44445.1 hypothetical protein BP01DRAFT_357762 [Aspergillus saccharolyticus JOP 1030-1]
MTNTTTTPIPSNNPPHPPQNNPITNTPRIGIAVLIFGPNNLVLLGQRLGSHGAGTWALPGGHLEPGETWEACAAREVCEETGLKVSGLTYLTATNDLMPDENKHYVTIFMGCELADGAAAAAADGALPPPPVLEPNKCAEWRWVNWQEGVMRWFHVQERAEADAEDAEAEAEGAEEENAALRDGDGTIRVEYPLFLPLRNLLKQRKYYRPFEEYQMLAG